MVTAFNVTKSKPASVTSCAGSNHLTSKEKMIHAMLPLARGNDPITSFQAADSAKAFIASHEIRILLHLQRHGPMGVDNISDWAGLEAHAVGKRMAALAVRGAVRLTGKTVRSNSGRQQREWQAV